jgi:hypothetical protein
MNRIEQSFKHDPLSVRGTRKLRVPPSRWPDTGVRRVLHGADRETVMHDLCPRPLSKSGA